MAQLKKESQMEIWDDDEFESIDNLHFRNASTATTASKVSNHRQSFASRMSVKSDHEDEGDWQMLLANDDEASTRNAIENAKRKGINLPSNLPASALIGGTITKLQSTKSRKQLRSTPVNDWDDDFERPATSGLKLRIGDRQFPDTLRTGSGEHSAATSPLKGRSFAERMQNPGLSSVLNKYRDDDEDVFGDIATIKVSKSRSRGAMPDFNVQAPAQPLKVKESFDGDFDLPSGTLKLSSRTHTPKTPASAGFEEADQDWAGGSYGSLGSINTSVSGAKRTGKSARSSSISARSPSVFSPSLSSCLTAESEDEGLDCFVLPPGPLNLGDALKKRLQFASPELEPVKIDTPDWNEEDLLDGLELGSGPVFDTGKLTLNRNIKQRQMRQASPPRRPATSLTFTNKAPAANTRIPKPASGMERPRSKLEPVAESGGPMSHYRNSTASRMTSHSQQSSLTSVPTPTSTAPQPIPPPSTPSRRGLTSRASRDVLRQERPEAAQHALLKSKRSLPAMSSTNRVPPSPARPAQPQPGYARPTSRQQQDRPLRPTLGGRPRTPVDRESSLAAARRPPSYAASTSAQPRQLTKQGSRTFHRPTSSDDNNGPQARPTSRLSDRHRSNTPSTRRDVATKNLVRAAAAKQIITEPKRRRGYGDGTELEGFDDLPTSVNSEAKFTKAASTTIKATTSRRPISGIIQVSTPGANRSEAPSRLALSPTKVDNNVPSWARSTAASRLAKEQRLGPASVAQAQRHPGSVEPRHTTATQWQRAINNKPIPSPRHAKQPLPGRPPPRKPQLINNRGLTPITRNDSGMKWDPTEGKWEGNEAALVPFDLAPSPKRSALNLNQSSATKPALIANFSTTKGVQVVGGMVFDPEKMLWVKMSAVAKSTPAHRDRSDSLTNTTTTDDGAIFDLDLTNLSDDEDPFAGIADLPDENTPLTQRTAGQKPKAKKSSSRAIHSALTSPRDSISGMNSSSSEEEATAEEFDVGPGFVKRQQAEEEKWRRRLKGWEAVLGKTGDVLGRRGELRELISHGQRQ